MPSEPDSSLKEMVGQLAADSKQLVSDEVRLAQLEIEERSRGASAGLAGISAAFGIAVIAASAATLVLAIVIANVSGNRWLGAAVVGAIELLAGIFLYRHGRLTLAGRDHSSAGAPRI